METNERILVIDDEQGICQNVEKILRKSNYEVAHALSAEDALEKMAKGAFSLLISDIVMPGGMNGLEFLRMVKDQWPLTKVIMMTAYASTDTAMKAIRLGALDYLPKPFTPDELRAKVEEAVSGELVEFAASKKEREIIDVDIPFDLDEVAQQAGEDYARRLGPSDMPVVEMPSAEEVESFCSLGAMVCDIFKKLGKTCKAGLKTQECPQLKAKKKKAAAQAGFDASRLIGIDQPFNYEEVAAVTGPEYVRHMGPEGFSYVPYEELKQNVARMLEEKAREEEAPAEAPAPREILVVDDEVAVNNNIRKILSKKGYEVDQAMTKEEALQKTRENAYKMVLLDLKIPGVKGLELLEAVRESNPDARVIIITGYASIDTAVEAARMGAVDYLPKPFTPDEIRSTAEKAFQLAA